MAHVYDYLHDSTCVSGLPYCIPIWYAAWLLMMDIQLIIVLAVGICACMFMLREIVSKFKKSSQNTPCGVCRGKEGTIPSDK